MSPQDPPPEDPIPPVDEGPPDLTDAGLPEDAFDAPQSSGGKGWVVLVFFLVAAAGGAAYWLLTRPTSPVPPVTPIVIDAGAPEEPLEESDGKVRSQLMDISSDPAWAEWIKDGDLIRRFTAVVNAISEGESPRVSVPFLAPKGKFLVKEPKAPKKKVKPKKGHKGKPPPPPPPATLDPKSYDRYNPIASTFASIDAQKAGTVFKAIHPLCKRAWKELGAPGTSFDSALKSAMKRLIDVPPLKGTVLLVPKGAGWAYKDEELEKRSEAEKHLLRMGPTNQEKIQAKLKELRDAFEL